MSDLATLIASLMRDIHYNLIRKTRPELHERGLTPPRFHALAHVANHGPINMSEIRKRLHVSKSTATAVVDGLVNEGLLRRHRPDEDRRCVIIEVTDAGRRVMEETRQKQAAYLRSALQKMKARLERRE